MIVANLVCELTCPRERSPRVGSQSLRQGASIPQSMLKKKIISVISRWLRLIYIVVISK